jgi:hypothetical protein
MRYMVLALMLISTSAFAFPNNCHLCGCACGCCPAKKRIALPFLHPTSYPMSRIPAGAVPLPVVRPR